MKAIQEKDDSNKALLWLALVSIFAVLIGIGVKIFIGSDIAITPNQVSSQAESVEVFDETVHANSTDNEIQDQKENVALEVRSEIVAISSDQKEVKAPEKVVVKKEVKPADVIPENQTIARLISANAEARKKRVAVLINEERRSVADQKTLLIIKQLELDSTPQGEKRVQLFKAQEQRKLELAVTESSLRRKQALLDKLNHKVVEYSQSQF